MIKMLNLLDRAKYNKINKRTKYKYLQIFACKSEEIEV